MCNHLKEVGESYFKHFRMSMTFAIKTLVIATIFMVHAVLPCVFKKTGSNKLQALIGSISNRK